MSINALKTCKNNILMGDFNFHSTWVDQQAKIYENEYTDVFLDLNNN